MADISSITLPGGGTYDLKDNNAVHTSDKGVANGVASLDSIGKVPSSQLPPIPSDAEDITYDPTTSSLTATNVQAAIDEVVANGIDYLTVVNGKICVIYEVTP